MDVALSSLELGIQAVGSTVATQLGILRAA
jgi:hypothetical protein